MAEIRSVDTRERILDNAERLFMAHGYEGASLRRITREAAVNLAAVNYHFGSKEALMEEVFRRRLDWLNGERLQLLDEMERGAGGRPLQPSQIVDAFFGTLLRMAGEEKRGGLDFLRLLGRAMAEPSNSIRTFVSDRYRPVVERFLQALFRALPEMPKAEIVWRFHFMQGAASYAIAGIDPLDLAADREEGLDDLLPRLQAFLLGGLRAPPPRLEVPRGERRFAPRAA